MALQYKKYLTLISQTHELTLKKMAEDAESNIAIRFVDEND